ncbi:anti-sigma regulatory factor (Ser/Thr protein kinase) [Lysinibacillus parviboronicapiens]|uniref:Anti-sigma regulatory factor (Ser/Thr protein kinase) n=1 Tax=Lysinibacillus parviboronicapiens TaxID=436516 RepID=A0ABV2PNI4_9BACI
MKVFMPRELDRDRINELMINVLDSEKKPLYKQVELDFTTLKFIQPAGVVALDNMIEWLYKRDVRVDFTYYTNIVDKYHPIKYLDDSGFFEKHLGKRLVKSATLRSTTISLQNVAYEESFSWLQNTFTPWLAQQLGVKKTTLGNIEMCLGEIFNNIKDHSSENIGCLYAQHYPQKKLLTFCIADFGVGIPYNIKRVFPDCSDSEALLHAIEEGFTTKTSPRNLGAGLYTMIKNIVINLKGSVHINSGYGILNVYSDKGAIVTDPFHSDGFYPGTFLEFNINTAEVEKEDLETEEEEEFEW